MCEHWAYIQFSGVRHARTTHHTKGFEMSDGYNGWSNYETWCANLWIDNEQGSQEYWREQSQAALESADWDIDEAVSTLAEQLKSEHEESMPELTGVFSDLLTAALGSVDWREIARSMLGDIEIWSAGFNMPGYMPESEPARFGNSDDAREYIADEMTNYADSLADSSDEADEAKSQALTEAADTVRDGAGEYGQTVGQYHYWVSKVQ